MDRSAMTRAAYTCDRPTCDGDLTEVEHLAGSVALYECEACEEWFEVDTETDTIEADR